MGLSSSLSGVSFSGLGSGIDSSSIIQRLVALESIPIARMQNQRAELSARKGVMQAFRERIGAFGSAANALTSSTAFNPVKANSSKPEVATISAAAGAVAGTYNLTVSKLAQSHKISSIAQSGTSQAVGLAGTVIINGRSVAIEAADTLTGIAQRINGASAGVTASIIDGGAGQAYLTLTSNTFGSQAAIQIADLSGGVASGLGLISGGISIRQAITNGAASATFSSATTPLGTLWNATGIAPQTVQINGIDVSLDLQTQSLQDIANTINAASTGATAAVKSVTENGATKYRLEITGASTPSFTDAGGALAALGLLQQGFGNQLVAAQNAEFTLDGISFSTASNEVTSVIPGVTLTLLKANQATPETSTLTLTQDNSAVKSTIKEFMNAFNNIVDFVKQHTAFDKDTFQSGLLFGDSTVQTIEAAMASAVFANVQGLSTNITNLAQLGFTFDSDSKLKLDEARLDAALNESPQAVANLFKTTGESTAASLTYISATSKTVSSGAGLYQVNISQIATKGSVLAGMAQSGVSTEVERLKFNGGLFGNTEYELVLSVGNSLAATVDQINNDARLKDLVVASVDGGKLKIESKRYGTLGNFTVYSNLDPAANNTGLGTQGGDNDTVITNGVDVAGTINGEPATGSGQFLTGNSGNANTEGLQIQYTGAALGVIGSIRVVKGLGSSVNDLVSRYTDSISGFLTEVDKGYDAQMKSIDERIEETRERIALHEENLKRKFAAMELAIAQLQQQSARMSSMSAANRTNQ